MPLMRGQILQYDFEFTTLNNEGGTVRSARWWSRHNGTVNSSLTLRPNAAG
jgi:hypothetical protein